MPPMGKSERPILDIPRSGCEWALEGVGIALLLLTWGIVWLYWPELPERIPRHFGAGGKPDAWGGKGLLLTLPSMATALFVGLSVLSRFPRIYNYPFEITEENAERQYRLARALIECLAVEIVVIFGFLSRATIQVALGRAGGLGAGFTPAVLTVTLGTIGIYIWMAYRAR